MSYHKFPNLREIFQGDLSRKLTTNVQSMDFMDRPCNCRGGKDKNCAYNGDCRKTIVVYKATCKECEMIYIGNTQQTFKQRMRQHFGETQRLITKGEFSDSFAKHFANHFSEKPTPQQIREKIKLELIWQGNPLSAVKTFRQHNCVLCMRERIEIVKMLKEQPGKLINSCAEIYGTCRHNPKFHRFYVQSTSTDEREKRERVESSPTVHSRENPRDLENPLVIDI